jgi:NAD(P)-dependent dehydrogenase (short-subunit alcohol dehydrogenase family)
MEELDPTPAVAEQIAPVVRLRPIRTLVVSHDLDYKERALRIISELGPTAFAVGSLSVPDDIVDLVASERAHVLVLDATDREHDVAAVISRLADPFPRVGIVVVCHHCSAAALELDALPKWGWTQDLRAGVERAYVQGNPLCPGLLASVRRNGASQRRGRGPLSGR